MKDLIWTIFFGLTACSNLSGDKPQTNKIFADSSSTSSQEKKTVTTANLTIPKDELTKIYTHAMAEFIRAAYKNDKTTFDTLYFGKHVYGQPDDFPDIDLPEAIEKTQIRLIDPEVGQKMWAERMSMVYVNMMGWVDAARADFVFVVFSNGGQHHYDYFLNFAYNTSTRKLELDKIEFERYYQLNGQDRKRVVVYQDGRYVTDR